MQNDKPSSVDDSATTEAVLAPDDLDSNAQARRLAGRIQETGHGAIDAANAYAHKAVDAAADAIDQAQRRYAETHDTALDYIHADPVRAVKLAAAGGSIAMILFAALSRR